MTSNLRPMVSSTSLTEPPWAEVPHRTRHVGSCTAAQPPACGPVDGELGNDEDDSDGVGDGSGLLLPPHAASTAARAPATASLNPRRMRVGGRMALGTVNLR